MLSITNLTCSYGDIVAVDDLSLSVAAGEVFGLIGANGAGKTTVIKSISGLISPRSGMIAVNGQDITHTPVHRRIKHGISLVPEGRRIFADLTVEENLTVGAAVLPKLKVEQGKEAAYRAFTRLKERRTQLAGSLSGGEQQMLAMSRALMSEPSVLLIDELSLGLMPIAIDECYRAISELRATGISILLVEQSTERVVEAADRIAIMESGRITWTGTGSEARRDDQILRAYLGLGDTSA